MDARRTSHSKRTSTSLAAAAARLRVLYHATSSAIDSGVPPKGCIMLHSPSSTSLASSLASCGPPSSAAASACTSASNSSSLDGMFSAAESPSDRNTSSLHSRWASRGVTHSGQRWRRQQHWRSLPGRRQSGQHHIANAAVCQHKILHYNSPV